MWEKGLECRQVPIYLITNPQQYGINVRGAEKQHLQSVHEPSVRLRLLRCPLSWQFVDWLTIRNRA